MYDTRRERVLREVGKRERGFNWKGIKDRDGDLC